MKKLMELYDDCTLEEKDKIDKFFISSINHYDYTSYGILLIEMNKNSHITFLGDRKIINEKFEEDITIYFNKLNFENICYNPIIIELLNNDDIYNKYIKDKKEDLFLKMITTIKNYPKLEEKEKKQVEKLINNLNKSYDNFYYNQIMLCYLEMIINNYKLSLKNLNKIVEYFIYKESFENKINVNFEIINIKDVIKKVFNFKLNKESFSKQNLEVVINNKKNLINKYKKSLGCQKYYENLNKSIIEINIFNFYKLFFDKNFAFQLLIDVIYHEIRHAYQISGNDLKLKNEYERTNILNCDYEFYLKNHDYIFSEVDANIYSLEKRKELFENYFYIKQFNEKKYKEQKYKILVNYYNKKLEIDKKVDILMINNDLVKENTLNLEYENTGYPKDIFTILNEQSKNDNIIYNEIIIRCLNRLDKKTYINLIKYLKENNTCFLNIIDKCLIKKIGEINNDLLFLEENFKGEYEENVLPYTSLIYYYYLELLKIKKQNRVDKCYCK